MKNYKKIIKNYKTHSICLVVGLILLVIIVLGLFSKFSGDAEDLSYSQWQRQVTDAASSFIGTSTEKGGDIGGDMGGEQGRRFGSNIGALVGEQATKVVSSMIASTVTGKVGMDGEIGQGDAINVSALYTEIYDSVLPIAQDYSIAHTLADGILEGQEQAISELVLDYVHSLRDVPELTAAYDKNNFCGATNDEFTEEILSKIILHTLRLKLEGRIIYDLGVGMTSDELREDISVNVDDDMQVLVRYAIWDIEDACRSYVTDDFYTLLFNGLFVVPFDSNNNGVLDASEVPDVEVDGFDSYNHLKTNRPSSEDIYVSSVGDFSGYIPNSNPMPMVRGGGA